MGPAARAIDLARKHDPKVIVEAAIPGRELECGVLEFPDGRVEASTVGEIRVAGVRGREDAFYDFETKYLDDAAELDVPAKIDDDVADAVRQLAIRAFNAIDCQGLARVDFFLTDEGPSSTKSTPCPASPRSRCIHGCGRPAAWTIRRCWPPWSTRRSSAAPVCVRHPAVEGNILLATDAQTDKRAQKCEIDAPFRRSRRF